jgi:hypothetical protein
MVNLSLIMSEGNWSQAHRKREFTTPYITESIIRESNPSSPVHPTDTIYT